MTARTFTFHLDEKTRQELTALTRHFSERDQLERKINPSQVIRAAIHQLHKTEMRATKKSR